MQLGWSARNRELLTLPWTKESILSFIGALPCLVPDPFVQGFSAVRTFMFSLANLARIRHLVLTLLLSGTGIVGGT